VRIQNRNVIQPGRARWRWRAARAFPGVQPDVMMITAGREERGLSSHPLRDLEAQDVAVECERSFEVGHFEVDVTNSDARIDRSSSPVLLHGTNVTEMAFEASPRCCG